MKIEKEFLQKKKKERKDKILINTAISVTLENCCVCEKNWVGGLEHGNP